MTEQATATAPEQQFAIQRVYCKDVSFETPNSPDIFKGEWKPQIKLELNHKVTRLSEEDHYEMALTVTVTATVGDKTAFLAEVQQAGIFLVKGFEPAQREHMLGAYCPSVLFPYAREAIDNLVTRGSFPAVMLAPVNFDAMFAQALKNRAEAQAQKQEEPARH